MFEDLDDPNPPIPGPQERGQVMARGEELVGRRRLLGGLGIAVAVALIALVAGVIRNDGSDHNVQTAAGTASSQSAPGARPGAGPDANAFTPAPGESSPVSVLGTQFTASTTTTTQPPAVIVGSATKPTPAAPKPGPTTTTTTAATAGNAAPPPCRNSYDPACGPFRWDPDPGPNQGITGGVTYSQATPGAKVTFTVTGDDPDAAPLDACNIDFGDGMNVRCDPRPTIDPSYCRKQYGPWTPPAKNDGKLNSTLDHDYASPGTYHVVFDVRSAMPDCNNPYASTAQLQADIVVT